MTTTNKIEIAKISDLKDNQPIHALVKNTDLVITKHETGISVYMEDVFIAVL